MRQFMGVFEETLAREQREMIQAMRERVATTLGGADRPDRKGEPKVRRKAY